jgi:hypothetical protein
VGIEWILMDSETLLLKAPNLQNYGIEHSWGFAHVYCGLECFASFGTATHAHQAGITMLYAWSRRGETALYGIVHNTQAYTVLIWQAMV